MRSTSRCAPVNSWPWPAPTVRGSRRFSGWPRACSSRATARSGSTGFPRVRSGHRTRAGPRRPAVALRRPQRAERGARVRGERPRTRRLARRRRRPAQHARPRRTGRRPTSAVRRGLRQKTSLVLALTRPFSVLLIDEPFVGLDPAGQDALTEILIRRRPAVPRWSLPPTNSRSSNTRQRCVVLEEGTVVYDDEPDLARIAPNSGVSARTAGRVGR